jgi:mycothiol synthase
MIELRPAETDDELELWRSVRSAVLPNERTASVAELRSGGSFMLLAFRDGELAGSGSASKSDLGGGAVTPRVLPAHRRQGVGTALLQQLARHAEECGYDEVGSMVDDPGSLAFAERFGFSETGRQVEQVRPVGPDEPWPAVPDDIEVVTVAERPELLPRLYHELALQAFEDMPTPRKVEITPEQWETEWLNWPEAAFVALSGGEVVGMAGLNFDADQPDRAENTLTAVRRDRRGRGLARMLKETATAWASTRGIREIYTWTQTGNENMRAVNERLGFSTRDMSISVRRALPL